MDEKNKTHIASVLHALRISKGYTLGEVAKILDVSEGNISHYEKGRAVPSLKILIEYRLKLGLDLNVLAIGREEVA